MFDFLSKLIGTTPNAERICCFHFGRCGSTLLGNMLDSHPQLEWGGELFHSHHERKDRSAELKPFELLRTRIANSKFRHFGFETKFQHLDENGLDIEIGTYLSKLSELGFHKFIVLKRKNYLRQAISVARGQRTRKWHISTSEALPESEPLKLDIDCVSLGGKNRPILDCFQFLEQTYSGVIDTFQENNCSFCEIGYEDHLQEQPFDGYRQMIEFIGIPYVEPKISVRKLESRPIDQIVSNFEDLLACLEGSKYEWMCHQ